MYIPVFHPRIVSDKSGVVILMILLSAIMKTVHENTHPSVARSHVHTYKLNPKSFVKKFMMNDVMFAK